MRRFCAIAAALILCACRKAAPISEREAATELLAKHLDSTLRPKSVLVISNPYSQQPGRPSDIYKFEKASLAGLTRGFGKQVQVKNAFPELRPEALTDPSSVSMDPQTTTPLSFLVADHAFQKLVDESPGCEVVITLIGVPVNLAAFPAWSSPGLPKFALFLPDWRLIGGPEAIVASFRNGKIAAAIVQKDGAFSLVTAENVASLIKDDPRLFGL